LFGLLVLKTVVPRLGFWTGIFDPYLSYDVTHSVSFP
jgi:hypothetical protein